MNLGRGVLKSVVGNFSFAPAGLDHFPLRTQGLRPGLHSDAASRLKTDGVRANALVLTRSLNARNFREREVCSLRSALASIWRCVRASLRTTDRIAPFRERRNVICAL
jgi:hypothetical protein